MAKLIGQKNEIIKCVCGGIEFKILPHQEFTDALSQMAFCLNCGRGKAISLWQSNQNVGYVERDNYELQNEFMRLG